ncbi:MAG: hypothetical protein I8H86_10185 [Sphingomonadaceae bacterium]|nr:hypothetical protein [Sphingomonadaceae bacterium]MBH1998218.1 hypothetical protein [Sphingomonadaceae bacterium]
MNILASLRLSQSPVGLPVIAQCALILIGLAALHAMPPVSGRMLLVPVTEEARATLAPVAIAHGARLVAAGPWAGSLVVDGQRDLLTRPLLDSGVVTLSAHDGGCGERV